ncbi:MAG TPA: hypothetical protein VK039_11435, partial [Brevibacterium sp.]|nr:hypothetical protein [Brevibacterium sp.]
EEGTPAEDIDPTAIDEALRGIRAGGTDLVLIPVGAPLLHWSAAELAAAFARTPGVRAELVEDVWVVDLGGLDDAS